MSAQELQSSEYRLKPLLLEVFHDSGMAMQNEAKSPQGHRIMLNENRESVGARQLVSSVRSELLIAKINRYDRRMFESETKNTGDFTNFGYWERHTRSYGEACENLMEHLLAFIPEKKGAILDVGV